MAPEPPRDRTYNSPTSPSHGMKGEAKAPPVPSSGHGPGKSGNQSINEALKPPSARGSWVGDPLQDLGEQRLTVRAGCAPGLDAVGGN